MSSSKQRFVCKHVLTKVRGMLSKPSGTGFTKSNAGAGVVVGDDIEITVDAELVLQP